MCDVTCHARRNFGACQVHVGRMLDRYADSVVYYPSFLSPIIPTSQSPHCHYRTSFLNNKVMDELDFALAYDPALYVMPKIEKRKKRKKKS